MENQRQPRARRARYEDIVALRSEIAELRSELSRLRASMPGSGGLPLTKEEFTGRAIIATIQSGGWGQLKYAGQRADEAYRQWERLCGATNGEVPVLEASAPALTTSD
jgi:hypothetical protein